MDTSTPTQDTQDVPTTTDTATVDTTPADTTPGDNHTEPAPVENQGEQTDPRIQRANREAAARRVELNQQREANQRLTEENQQLAEKLESITRSIAALTGQASEETPVEEQLAEVQKQRDAALARINAMSIETAFTTAAAAHKVDPATLLVLAKGEGKLEGLDAQAETFTTQVETIAAELADKYAHLQAPTRPQTSGQVAPTVNEAGGKLTREQIAQLYAAGDYKAINAAAVEGRIAL